MTRQVTDQLYVELDYYYPEEYVVYIAEAVAACSSQATFVCDATEIVGGTVVEASGSWSSSASVTVSANKIIQGQSALTSAFTQTATISHIEGADLFAFTNALLTAQVAVIRDNNVAVSTQFSMAADAARIRVITADANSQFTETVSGLRSRSYEAALLAAFSTSASAERLRGVDSQASSQFIAVTGAVKTVNANIFAPSQFNLTAIGGKPINYSAAFLSTSSVSLTANEYSVGRWKLATEGNARFVETPTKFGSGSILLASEFNISLDQWARIAITPNTAVSTELGFASMASGVANTDAQGLNAQFGISFWFYPTSSTTSRIIFNSIDFLIIQNSLGLRVFWNGSNRATFSTGLTLNDWNYVVITRKWEGTTTRGRLVITINGTEYINDTTTTIDVSGTAVNPEFDDTRTSLSDSYLENFHWMVGDYIDWTLSEPTTELTTPTAYTKLLTSNRYSGVAIDLSGAQTEIGASIQAGTFTLTGTLSGPVRASAALSAQAIQIALGSITKLADSAMTSSASMVVSAGKIRDFASNQNSQAQLSADAIAAKSGVAAISSQASLAIDYIRYRDVSIQTDAIFSELVAIAKTGQGLIQADVVATMSVTAVKTTNITLSAASQFTQTTQVVKSVTVTASLSSAAALTVDNARTRNISSSLESNAQLTANVREIVQLAASLTAVTSVLADTGGIKQFNVIISSQASLIATILRIKDSSSSLASAFTSTAETANSRVVSGASALSSQANVTANPGTVKTSAVTTDAIFTELVAVAKTGQGFITLDVQATQTIVAVKTANAAANINAAVSLSVTATRNQTAAANLITAATFTVTGTFVTTALANISASATLSCQVAKTAGAISLEASAATLTAAIAVTKRTTISMSALAFEVAVINKTHFLQANISSQATLTVKIGGTFGFRSSMQGFAAEVAVIDIIHIDAKLTWIIFAEDRDHLIQNENRAYLITAEDRDYSIVNENRTYAVTRELLTTELQGV